MEESNQTNLQREPFPYHKYRYTYQILAGITFTLIGIWIGVRLVGQEESLFQGNALAYWTNIITEFLGVIVTVVVINQILIIRERYKLQKRLIRQAGSPSHAVATEAIAQLREEGWLTGKDGVLQGKTLRGANLQGVDLTDANLTGVNLQRANLEGAIMSFSNCEGADFTNANLDNVTLWGANVKQANLKEVSLRKSNSPLVDFSYASLEKTDFAGSNLKTSNFSYTQLSGTNFEGSDLLRAIIEQPTIGAIVSSEPEGRPYFTILPSGHAIAIADDLENFVQEMIGIYPDLPAITFVPVTSVDWKQFTDSSHPEYKWWIWEWRKQNWQEENDKWKN